MAGTVDRREFLKLGLRAVMVGGAMLLEPSLVSAGSENQKPASNKPQLTPGCKPTKVTNEGLASYYSESGCFECREDRLMANGKRFDENAMTLAYNKAPLGSEVLVKNVRNKKIAQATVTDRGGFEAWGRIADLSKGLARFINPNYAHDGLTRVKIIQLSCK